MPVSLSEFLLLLASIAVGVAGQFFLKTGALKLGRVDVNNAISHVVGILTTPELLLGLAFYGLAAIAYILVLTRVKLSIVGPAASLSYVFSVLLGYFVFREAITSLRLLGLGMIVAGVILVIWQK